MPYIEKDKMINVNENKLSMKSIRIIRTEFAKRNRKLINYVKVSKIVKRLKFFQKYRRGLRVWLLKWATLVHKKQGDFILK